MISKEIREQDAKISNHQKELKTWKDEYQKKNLNIFVEVSNALKGLKQEISKQKQDLYEKYDFSKAELSNF